MELKILGIPEEANDYEFIVVNQTDNGLVYVGHCEDGFTAERIADDYAKPLIIHNVRIQGKRKPEPKERYYTFSGMWSWGCWAKSEDDAKRQFDAIYYDDISIDDSHYKIEVED